MAWTDDLDSLHDDVLANFGESVTWSTGVVSTVLIDTRVEPRIFETQVYEMALTIEFRIGEITPARHLSFTRAKDGIVWKLGERVGGDEHVEVWSIRR